MRNFFINTIRRDWSSNDIIDKTEKLITKYGYGADDCRNLDENTWSAALPMRFVNMKEMGCFTNDLAFINNKIFFGWYRDDIKDSDLEEALAKFYGKVSNIPGFIIMFIQWFGINLRDSKLFDNENSTKRYDVDEYYEKLSLLIGLDSKKDRKIMNEMVPFLQPTKCDPVKLDELIDFDKGKDISKEFREKYKSNPFWYKSGRKLGCFSDASSCVTTRLTNLKVQTIPRTMPQHKAMKRGDKFYDLQEGGICKTSGNYPNNYEKLNFNNPAQECISDNQCNNEILQVGVK